MTADGIWHVRGVSGEVQGKAKALAKYRGVSQGKLVTELIEKAAAESGVVIADRNLPGTHHAQGSHEGPMCNLCDPSPVLENRAETPHELVPEVGLVRKAKIGKRVTKKNARAVAAKAKPEKKTAKAPKTCTHGTRVGFNCWQCGGIAKVAE